MSGLDYWDWLALENHRRAEKGSREASLLAGQIMGIDLSNGSDYSVYTTARVPGRLRRFLRLIGLDRSNWKFKIIKQELVKDGKR